MINVFVAFSYSLLQVSNQFLTCRNRLLPFVAHLCISIHAIINGKVSQDIQSFIHLSLCNQLLHGIRARFYHCRLIFFCQIFPLKSSQDLTSSSTLFWSFHHSKDHLLFITKNSHPAAHFTALFIPAKSSQNHLILITVSLIQQFSFSAIFIIIKSSHTHHNDQHWNLIKSGSYSRKPLKPIFLSPFRPPRFGIDFQTFKWR